MNKASNNRRELVDGIISGKYLQVDETLLALNDEYVEAVIEVTQIIDKYSVYALSSVLDGNILIEFENEVNYKVGERVLIVGSLELSEIS